MMLLQWLVVLLVSSLACCLRCPDCTRPPQGQRCAGRNYNGRRCCTPEQPCGEGEGDCDGPGDGGGHDGHAGCRGNLQCGSNNCQQFGAYYHPKDDCCERPRTSLATPGGGWAEWGAWSSSDYDYYSDYQDSSDYSSGIIGSRASLQLECPSGQRCCGRNYNV